MKEFIVFKVLYGDYEQRSVPFKTKKTAQKYIPNLPPLTIGTYILFEKHFETDVN